MSTISLYSSKQSEQTISCLFLPSFVRTWHWYVPSLNPVLRLKIRVPQKQQCEEYHSSSFFRIVGFIFTSYLLFYLPCVTARLAFTIPYGWENIGCGTLKLDFWRPAIRACCVHLYTLSTLSIAFRACGIQGHSVHYHSLIGKNGQIFSSYRLFLGCIPFQLIFLHPFQSPRHFIYCSLLWFPYPRNLSSMTKPATHWSKYKVFSS